MRMCVIAYTFYDTDDRVRRYAEALVEQGHEIDAIVLQDQNQPSKSVLNGVNIFRIQKRAFNEKHISQFIIRIMSFFIRGSILVLFRHLRKPYRLFHIHNVPDFLVFMSLLPKLLGAKVILDIHDILPELFCQKFNKNMSSLFAKTLLFIEKISVLFADHVIIANDLWRQKISKRQKLTAKSCSTYMNYPQLAYFKGVQKKSDNGKLTIIYPGTISHIHGTDVLIRAIPAIKAKLPNIEIMIYTLTNNQRYFYYIQQIIKDLGVEENVHFFDTVPAEELHKIYSTADIGVVPKRAGVFASGAFSTKIFDYMAAGLPIVSSKTEIDAYYFDDSTILFFEPENHEELAARILELAGDHSKRERLIQAGLKHVAVHNWEGKKTDYVNLVNTLLQ